MNAIADTWRRATEPAGLAALASEILLCSLAVPPAFVLAAHNNSMSDLGFQLMLGRSMIDAGSPFVREQFAVGHMGEMLVPNSWLAQVVFYLLSQLGMNVLKAFNALLFMAGFFVAAWPAWRRGERPLALVLALALPLTLATPAFAIRPQNFAVLGFGALLLLLRNPKVLPAIVLFVIWQNLHPSIALAALVTGAAAIVGWIRRENPWRMAALCLIAIVATFATPAGLDIVPMAAQNAKASVIMDASEWFPLWDPDNAQYLGSVLILTPWVAYAAYKQRPPVIEWLPAVVTLTMSIFAARFLVFYAIATVPVLARLRIGPITAFRSYGAALTGFAAAGLVLASTPARMEELIPRRITDQIHGVVYSDTIYGGELIDRGFKVAIDGRHYLYAPDELDLYKRTLTKPTLAEITARYSPGGYVLSTYRNAALIRAIETSGQWRRIYQNDDRMVFSRRAMLP